MRVLLDTHTMIWWQEKSSRIGATARHLMSDPDVEVCISTVSLWELAIKRSLGKIKNTRTPLEYLAIYRSGGAELLQILPVHIMAVETLPFHHRDPFDRMLIAQAKTENLTLLTVDEIFSEYDVQVEW